MKIFTLVGGISKNSLNKKLYKAVKALAPTQAQVETFDISQLPYYSQDIEHNPPEIVRQYKDKIKEAQAVLFITPEYNRSFPGVLKNALDWGSRPYGHNLWNGKPAAVMGASTGSIGTFGAQHHLRQSLVYLNVHTMGQPEFYFNASKSFNEQGELTDETTKKLIHQYWEAFIKHIEMVQK